MSPKPEVIGRHRLHHIVVKQGDQGVEVVPLEGVDVPTEQGLLLVVHGQEGVRFGRLDLRQRRSCPLQCAVDRGHRGLQQIGDLLGLPAEHLAQNQDRPLSGRKTLQGSDQGETHRFPRYRHLRRISARGKDDAVRDRLDPGDLGQRGRQHCVGGGGGPEVHGASSALPALEHVEADIGRDSVEPGPQGRTTLESVDGPPSPDQALLDRILRLE